MHGVRKRWGPTGIVLLAAVLLMLMMLPVAAFAAPTAEDCAACHTIPPSHASAHVATGMSGNVQLFSGSHEGDGNDIGVNVDCGVCHDTSNVAAIHDDRCGTCHPTPADTFTSWSAGCKQGGCHTGPIHANATAGHAAVVAKGFYSGCVCHDQDTWEVPISNCGKCHTLADHAAPVTTSDAKTAYIGPGTIRLSATDLPSPGGSGVAHTYVKVDGGAQQELMSINVTAPPAGTVAHAIEFWSVDNAGNAETHKSALFTVTADTTPPSTTSNAVATYYGPANITLNATDNGTTRPSTYYRLDGGSQVSSTTLTVPQPPSGSVGHTLEFWSVDAAGNVETPHKTVSFTMIRDNTPPTTTTDAQPFYKAGLEWHINYVATDSGSGVATTYYKLDGGPQLIYPYVRVYSSLPAGTHTVEIWSVDKAGNAEPHHMLSFVLDGTAPTTTSDAVPTYTGGSATIHLTGNDGAGSGVAWTYYRLDGAAAVWSTVVTVTGTGAHTLEFWSGDNVGNVETTHKSTSFTINP